MRRLPLAALLVLATGCATTMSTMDTARTVKPGHVQFHAAYGFHLPVGTIAKGVIAGGEAVAESIECGQAQISPQQAERLYEAGVAMALNPPSAQYEMAIRTGVFNDLDVGLRYSSNALRLDTKLRFLHKGVDDTGKSHHLSIGFGASKYLFNNAVFEALEYVKLDNFSRWDFEVPLLYSWEYRRFFVFYTGLKYTYSMFELDENLYEIQKHVANMADLPPITDRVRSGMHMFGGTIGLGGGYKWIWIYTELSMAYVHLRPSLYSFADGKTKERNLDGFSIYPAIGIVVKI